jgi:hypothetical protein
MSAEQLEQCLARQDTQLQRVSMLASQTHMIACDIQDEIVQQGETLRRVDNNIQRKLEGATQRLRDIIKIHQRNAWTDTLSGAVAGSVTGFVIALAILL